MIERNPAIGVKLPRQRPAKPAIVLTFPEIKRVIDYLQEPTRTIVILIVFASMRVGGLPAGKGLRITASDGFVADYDAARLAAIANGTYQMWDHKGTTTIADDEETTGSVQLVVAYKMDGSPLDAATGPLRVVLIRPEPDRVTEGKYSPYLVTSISVR